MDETTATRLTESVADEIRALIARRRLSAAKLAQELGWSQPYMARRMTGAQSFDLNDLQELARVLKIKVSELIAHAESGDPGYVTVGFRGASVTPTAPVVPRSRTGDQPVLPDHPLLEHRLPMPGGWSRKTAPTGRL